MLVLGIDTATKICGVGLYDTESGLLGEYNLALEQSHSVRLMPMLESLLKAVGKPIGAVDGFAVSVGPGSFTGVRIGVTSAKTLAQVTDKPIVGISTIEATAYNLTGVRGIICPIFDARNRRVYLGKFASSEIGIERISEDGSSTIDELVQDLKNTAGDVGNPKIFFLGDAAYLYQAYLTAELGARAVFAPKSLSLPKGGNVAELGGKKLALGITEDLYALSPNYLKPTEAEINWQKKYEGR